MKRSILISFLALGTVALACGVDDTKPILAQPAPEDAGAEGGIPEIAEPAVPCNDTPDAVYGDPGPLPADKGAIIKCTKDPDRTKDVMTAKLAQTGYQGKPLTTDARVYRITYRTERGDAANTPGYTSAQVWVPKVPRAEKLPIVVLGRGSRGQGPDCTVSKEKPGLGVNDDYYRNIYPLVGAGYAVIVPDLPGYANFGAANNPPSAYAQWQDVGKATLDGSRALKKMFPQLDDKTFIVGHSQGGHNALVALAQSSTYGQQGTLAGVAVYSPLWFALRTFGAVLDPDVAMTQNASIAQQPTGNAVAVWYLYTHAELLDGAGAGAALIKADKRDAIKNFVNTQCWDPPYPALEALGTYLSDIFEDAFWQAVGYKAGLGGTCDDAAGVCQKWIDRFIADRPHLTGSAAKVPLYLLYGGKDTTIPPNRARCGFDRLKDDGVNMTSCYDPNLDHQSIVDVGADRVVDWIANLSYGGPPPAACPAGIEAVTTDCASIPPND